MIRDFGEREFDETAYFNFDGNIGIQSIFEYDFDVDRIIEELGSVIYDKKIVPGRTLVIFDEIQDCPRAIQSLKYFCENMPELHVIAAGSLLGVALRKEGISFPVGKVDRMEMFPISFEEFVRADGGEKYINSVQKMDFEREIPELYTIPLEKDLKNYYIVGGMPDACRRISDSKVGNVYTDRLADIWLKPMEGYRQFENFSKCSKKRKTCLFYHISAIL